MNPLTAYIFTRKLALACVFALFTATLPTYAGNMKVYKHVDAQGIIHYSSKKPRGKSYRILNIRCPECSEWRNSVDWTNTPLITNQYQMEIDHASNHHGVDKALLQAVIHAESAYKVSAVSSAGAQGLMQLMPLTQQTYEVNNPFDAQQNILGGAAYLKHLKATYRDMDVYLAAYNSGETAVERYGRQIPPFPETKEYVRRVKILYKRYKKNQQRLNALNNQVMATGTTSTTTSSP